MCEDVFVANAISGKPGCDVSQFCLTCKLMVMDTILAKQAIEIIGVRVSVCMTCVRMMTQKLLIRDFGDFDP